LISLFSLFAAAADGDAMLLDCAIAQPLLPLAFSLRSPLAVSPFSLR